MSKVTSKLQVSVPKSLAERYGIRPGDDVQWEAAGEIIRVIPPRRAVPERTRNERLEIFDQATRRQAQRQTRRKVQLSWFDAHLWAYADHYGYPFIAVIGKWRVYNSTRLIAAPR